MSQGRAVGDAKTDEDKSHVTAKVRMLLLTIKVLVRKNSVDKMKEEERKEKSKIGIRFLFPFFSEGLLAAMLPFDTIVITFSLMMIMMGGYP